MARTIGIGIQEFNQIIKEDVFYIDKTHFIKEWWDGKSSVTLIARPRRFGKTLTMSMVEQFFSVQYADCKDLFQGLSVWEDEKYRALQGTYPVISLSFASIKETNFEEARFKICQLITDLYSRNHFLLESGILVENERKFFQSVCVEMPDYVAVNAINKLSEYLSRYYNKKVIILLDEYDTPMQEAYVSGFWDELMYFIRNFLNATFKTNLWLERGLMTGITRVSKESVFSDLNNIEVITTTSNQYTDSFGFTEEEVFAALEEYGLSDKKERVKFWYDGFIFGKQKDIYNPWSILNFLLKKEYEPYWANTSSNHLVNKLIQTGDKNIKIAFEALLRDESIQCPIDEQIVYNQLDYNSNAVWSLLLACGYLKVLDKENPEFFTSGKRPMYELRLTNYEVKCVFLNMVQNWFANVAADYNDFVKALLISDVKAMNAYMNRVALQTFSYFDTGKGSAGVEPERFYHGFVLGLLVDLGEKYIITSNRESGFGRYDVMLEPRDKNEKAFIMEFKIYDQEDEDGLKDTVQSALKQIEDKKYASVLIAKGIPECYICKYGFAFEGKKVLIG